MVVSFRHLICPYKLLGRCDLISRLGSGLLVILGLSLMLVQCTRMVESTPEPACGFFVDKGTGQRLSWKGRIPIQMYVDTSVPLEFMPAIQDAIEAWNKSYGKMLFYPAIRMRIPRNSDSAQDGISSIFWWTESWFGYADEQARTNDFYSSGRITEADIYINVQSDLNPNGFVFHATDKPLGARQIDARAIFVHELGHVAGLVHNEVEGSSMVRGMAFSNAETEDYKPRRKPGPGDIENLKCEY
jgi:hypothetical protein